MQGLCKILPAILPTSSTKKNGLDELTVEISKISCTRRMCMTDSQNIVRNSTAQFKKEPVVI